MSWATRHQRARRKRDDYPRGSDLARRGDRTWLYHRLTSTSLWTLYNNGVERPYGLDLPEGLVKNQKLPTPVITPTTKAEKGQHDERLTCDEVVEKGLVEPELWAKVQEGGSRSIPSGTRGG